MTLPEVVPIFPLPNVVFFPRMPLPLHVFEPRYRALVREVAAGARLIGMTLLRDGWQQDYEGRPAVFPTGTVGEMVRAEERPDGRFDIVLRGLRVFTIVRELPPRAPFREVEVRWRPEEATSLPAGVRGEIVARLARYLDRLGRRAESSHLLSSQVDDETFVNFLAQHLDVAPIEKQALLEAAAIAERAQRLVDVLDFRLEELRAHPVGPRSRTQ
jgi:Lon protease-like protein